MATAQNIIDSASRKLGMPNPDAADSAVFLDVLNGVLGLWGGDDIVIPYTSLESFAVNAGVNLLTIGVGGDLNTPHPLKIEGMYFRDSNNIDYELTRMDLDQYSAIRDKSLVARPHRYYFEPVYPLAKISLSRTTEAAETLFINSRKRLTQLSALSSEFTLSEEYKTAIIYNLAVYAAADFSTVPDPITIDIAKKGMRTIRDKALLYNLPKGHFDGGLTYSSANRGQHRYNVNED